jgi:release factor glutamine methyltransferase
LLIQSVIMSKNKLHNNKLKLTDLLSYVIAHLLTIESIRTVDEAYIEAEIIISFVFTVKINELRMNFDKYKHLFKQEKLNKTLLKRLSGEPIAYIVGTKPFFDFNLIVGYGVLIPRPETEILVEKSLKVIDGFQSKKNNLNIVDVGTGSGAIIISLAKMLNPKKNYKFYAIDNSEIAIKYCKKNILKMELNQKINISKSDLLEQFQDAPDVTIANLPYIPTKNIMNLQKEVRLTEPKNALDGGKDGLQIIERLIMQLSQKINYDNYAIILEIEENQEEKLEAILKKYLKIYKIEYTHDLQDTKRVITISNNS